MLQLGALPPMGAGAKQMDVRKSTIGKSCAESNGLGLGPGVCFMNGAPLAEPRSPPPKSSQQGREALRAGLALGATLVLLLI